MIRKIFFILAISAMAGSLAFAKRIAPQEVPPIVYEGVKYTAPTGKMGVVEAYEVLGGNKLWEKKVYDVEYDPALEKDVQDIFIKELKIEHNQGWDSLIIVDERGREHEIIIKGRKDGLDPNTGSGDSK